MGSNSGGGGVGGNALWVSKIFFFGGFYLILAC